MTDTKLVITYLNMKTYTISDLSEIIGTRPTWSKLLATLDIANTFTRQIKGNQVVFNTELTVKEIKELFNTFKNENMKSAERSGRPKKEIN